MVGIRAVPTFRLGSDADSNLIRFVVEVRSMYSARTIDRRTNAAVDSIDYCFVVAIAADQLSYPYFVREMLVDHSVKHSVLDAADANY